MAQDHHAGNKLWRQRVGVVDACGDPKSGYYDTLTPRRSHSGMPGLVTHGQASRHATAGPPCSWS